jgi:hypothetical protein
VDHPLGIEQPVLAADVAARNAINTVRPVLVDPARGDYRVLPIDGPPAPPVTPPVAPPVTPPLGPAPTTRLVARFRAVTAVTGRTVTSAVITFNRAVTGVTADDFVLVRGRKRFSLEGVEITTTDQRTFTLSGIRRTHVAAGYVLKLRPAGSGITDAWGMALSESASVAWRMTRTVRSPRAVFLR